MILPPFQIITFLSTPEISAQPADKTINAGQSTTLSFALAQPSGILFQELYSTSYYWSSSSSLSGLYIIYLSSNSPTFNVTPSTAGTRYYKCTVTYTSNSDSTCKNSVTSDVAAVTAIETPAIIFNDVHVTDWFYNDVYTAVNMGLINGKSISPPLYVPNGNLTIAEAIKLAACMRQYYETGSVTLTKGNPWYQPYVDYCGALGIIGYHQYDGRYNEPATRAEYAVIFANSLPSSEFTAINNIQNGDIPDVPLTASYRAAVYKLYNAGIVEGTGTSHAFNPNTNIKRSEVAAILTRMMDDSARKTFSL